MMRTFACHDQLVHDPATGLTHQHPESLPTGRRLLDEAPITQLPTTTARSDHAAPTSLCWSPIVRCNLSCPQCLDDTSVSEAGRTHRHHIATILADSHVMGIDISGGEPLLLGELPELAATITHGGVTAVSVTTNGWHLARRAERLAECVDAVRVSLDGATRVTHDAIRGAGSFARACDGIAAAVDANIAVQIQFVLMRANASQAQPLVDLAAHTGAGGITFLQMLPIGAGAAIPQQGLDDTEARDIVANLDTPPGFRLRLRTRAAAGGFAVVRADGHIWRNAPGAGHIRRLHPLRQPADLIAHKPAQNEAA